MNFERMQISPTRAKELLQKNPMNRKLDQNVVEQYAEAMRKGDWHEESPEPIAFDPNGTLLNGQHRLHAIILAGKTLKLWVAKGVPKESFNVIDQGKKRTTGDAMTIIGINNANQVSAIIKAYLRVKADKIGHAGSDAKNRVYTKYIMDIYKKHPEYWDKVTVEAIQYTKDFSRAVAVSFIGGYLAAMNDLNDKDAKFFMERLTTGLGLTSVKDPIHIARKHYLDEKTAHKKHTTEYNHAIMRKAWKAFRKKEIISAGYFTYRKGDEIPKLV